MKKQHAKDLAAWVVILWTFGVTIARATREPNDFSESYWLLDYRFGFMKRGLIGTLCNVTTGLLGVKMTPRLITVLAAITLFGMSVAMLVIIFRTFRKHQARDIVLVLGVVFVSSPFVVMNAHLLGYFDALLYFLSIASVSLVLCNRPFWAGLVSVMAILSHESYLLIGFPLVCLASFLTVWRKENRDQWRAHLIALCIPVMVFLAGYVLQTQTTDATMLRKQISEHLDSFGFVPTRRKLVAEWQTASIGQLLQDEFGDFDERLLNPVVLATVGPTLLTLLTFIHTSYRIRAFSPFSIMLLGVISAPLAMHAVAIDTERISTYLIGGALICAWILAETRSAYDRSDNLVFLVALPTFVLNVFGRMPLMDAEKERFIDTTRLLIYLPAAVLFIKIVFTRISPDWLKEFKD